MHKLRIVLVQLLTTQHQLDLAIEMLPDMPQKFSLINARAGLRDYFEKDVVPKWRRLASLLSIDSNIIEGVKYLNDFNKSVPASILAQSIYVSAFDCLVREGKLVSAAAKLSARLSSGPMSGITDWFSGKVTPTSISDTQRGTNALKYFYDRAMTYDSDLPKTFEEFLNLPIIKNSDLVDGLGGTINSIDQDVGLPEYQIQGIMEKIADGGAGALPQNVGVFQQAVGTSAANPSFVKSIRYALIDTTKTVASGLQEGGQAAIESLSSSKQILRFLPFILLGAGVVVVYYYLPKKHYD